MTDTIKLASGAVFTKASETDHYAMFRATAPVSTLASALVDFEEMRGHGYRFLQIHHHPVPMEGGTHIIFEKMAP